MPINTRLIYSLKAECSKELGDWIHYQLPLTDRLRDANGDAHLELVSQNWIKTDSWCKNLLNIKDLTVFQREIVMKSHGTPYWYARSIIPHSCYELAPSFFDRLKNESIKNLIFDNDQVKRVASIHYPVDQQCVEFYWVKKHVDFADLVLWTRIAEFSFQESQSFYLIEIMLPKLGEICL